MVTTNASTTAPAKPFAYSPSTLRVIKISRMTRDAIGLVFGFVLIVYSIIWCFTTSWSYAWIIGIILVGMSFAAMAVHSTPFERDWKGSTRFLLSLLGLILGVYFLANSLVLVGLVGEKAVATIDDCHTATHNGHGTVCYAQVHWPDGTTSESLFNGYAKVGSSATFIKPPAIVSVLVNDEPQWTWPDALAFFGIAVAAILQALYSLGVLAFNIFHGSPARRAKHAAKAKVKIEAKAKTEAGSLAESSSLDGGFDDRSAS